MYPRTEYEMTQADLDTILDTCKPVPYMVFGGRAPRSPQENANAAWAALGQKMGFDHMTVRPIDGKSQRFFSAVPSETESARKDRLEREGREKRQQEITRIRDEIAEREKQLAEKIAEEDAARERQDNSQFGVGA